MRETTEVRAMTNCGTISRAVIFWLYDPEQVIGISSFLLSTALVQLVFNTFRWARGNRRTVFIKNANC